MGRERRQQKSLGRELKTHPGKRKMQMLLRGKLPTSEMLRILEHASKCRDCYHKLITETTRPKNLKKRR